MILRGPVRKGLLTTFDDYFRRLETKFEVSEVSEVSEARYRKDRKVSIVRVVIYGVEVDVGLKYQTTRGTRRRLRVTK